MTHEESNLVMKQKIADSFKAKMLKKPVQKITVSELVKDCNINRKTFYYHFEDIRALLKWILEAEAINIVKQFDLELEFEECIVFVMDYVEQNSFLLTCVYDNLGRETMRYFLYDDISEITDAVIDGIVRNNHIHTTDDFKDFVCSLFKESLVSILIDQFKHREKRSRETLLQYFSVLINYAIPEMLRHGADLQK